VEASAGSRPERGPRERGDEGEQRSGSRRRRGGSGRGRSGTEREARGESTRGERPARAQQETESRDARPPRSEQRREQRPAQRPEDAPERRPAGQQPRQRGPRQRGDLPTGAPVPGAAPSEQPVAAATTAVATESAPATTHHEAPATPETETIRPVDAATTEATDAIEVDGNAAPDTERTRRSRGRRGRGRGRGGVATEAVTTDGTDGEQQPGQMELIGTLEGESAEDSTADQALTAPTSAVEADEPTPPELASGGTTTQAAPQTDVAPAEVATAATEVAPARKPVETPPKTPAATRTVVVRPVGRAANDPRIKPRRITEVEIVTETLQIDPSRFPPVALPRPTRQTPPRAANDPRLARASRVAESQGSAALDVKTEHDEPAHDIDTAH
jgi:ribonuclease E